MQEASASNCHVSDISKCLVRDLDADGESASALDNVSRLDADADRIYKSIGLVWNGVTNIQRFSFRIWWEMPKGRLQ